MTPKSDEKKLLDEMEDIFGRTAVSETGLAIAGQSQSMAAGQSAMSSSQSSGRAMQNAVVQVQNSQSFQQAQTATGVASLLKRRSNCPHQKKKRFRNFIELGKAL